MSRVLLRSLPALPPVGQRKCTRRSEAGVAAVEMAVLLPVLLLILMAIADFGRVFYTTITLAHAAEAGALYGSQSNVKSADAAGIQQAATQEAQNIGAINVSSARSCQCPDGTAVDCIGGSCGSYGPPQIFVQVTADQTFKTLIPFPGMLDATSLSRTAVLRAQ